MLLQTALEVPGVDYANGRIRCSWDTAETVGQILGLPAPALPNYDTELPGLADYQTLRLHELRKPWHPVDIQFLLRRSYAILAEPMRSGKSFAALAAAIALGAKHVLIACPAIAKWVWADEVAQWTKSAPLLLEGRGMREARLYCLPCKSLGAAPDGTPCPHCVGRNGRSHGYRIIDVPQLLALPYRDVATGEMRWDDFGKHRCTRHPEVRSTSRWMVCGKCRVDLVAALHNTQFIVVNYDLLVPQVEILRGGREAETRFEGWVPLLKEIPFDVAIIDESHWLRAWRPNSRRPGKTRADRVEDLVRNIPRVWALTGTPFFGFTRDIWRQLHIISRGLYDERGFKFLKRYCGGVKERYGFKADGRGPLAETELKQRLQHVMIRRSRTELYGYVPPTPRQVMRLELVDAPEFRPNERSALQRVTQAAIHAVSKAKQEAMLDILLQEVAEGSKVVALVFHIDSARNLFHMLEAAATKRDVKARMREVDAKFWLVTSEDPSDPKAKREAATMFRAHKGGGVFVATTDSMSGAISLKGASAVYFIDLHWIPGALLQAEARAFAEDISQLQVIYVVARGTVDEHLEATVLPRVETLAKMVGDSDAQDILNAFGGIKAEEEQTFESVWSRLTAHLDGGGQ